MINNSNSIGFFEKYLTIWIIFGIIVGVFLGSLYHNFFAFISSIEYAKVNIPVAIFIWFMIYPMMVQIDFKSLKSVGKEPKGLILTLIMNWAVKPFTMALLALLFFKIFYHNIVDINEGKEYIAGMTLLGIAPCTAMVFVWSRLTGGNPGYTLLQVAINDIIMIFLFAPIAGLLLGMSNIKIPYDTLVISVLLYVVTPLIAGFITRKALNEKKETLERFAHITKPFSVIGLIAIVILLFAFQASTIIERPFVIILIAIPLLIQNYGIFAITYFAAYKLKLPFNIAAPASMIGASNFFELAVAVAISVFGLHSGAALATVVGVLVEVPVMLSIVKFANKTKGVFNENK